MSGTLIAAGTSAERATGRARAARQQALADARRSMVLTAARSAFLELGLEGASLREIAKRAGYTPGAIYSYFDSKEAVYCALLGESLERLSQHVDATAPQASIAAGTAATQREAQDTVRNKASAFFDFYRQNPRDLDLGFCLFHSMQPRGLTHALNEQLNARLRGALAPIGDGLVALGLSRDEAQVEQTALFAHIAGLLLLSHTGRIRMLRQASQALFERYLDALLARVASLRKARGTKP